MHLHLGAEAFDKLAVQLGRAVFAGGSGSGGLLGALAVLRQPLGVGLKVGAQVGFALVLVCRQVGGQQRRGEGGGARRGWGCGDDGVQRDQVEREAQRRVVQRLAAAARDDGLGGVRQQRGAAEEVVNATGRVTTADTRE